MRKYVESFGDGMHIGVKLSRVHGLLWGTPTHLDPELVEKFRTLTESGSGR